MKYYTTVTFGSPSSHLSRPKDYSSEPAAIKYANEAKGSGSCTDARVLECDTLELASTADISEIRPGEKCIFKA